MRSIKDKVSLQDYDTFFNLKGSPLNIVIDAQELDKIRGLPADAIVRCDECRRILVRTAESGL
jgi:hypothetical protein